MKLNTYQAYSMIGIILLIGFSIGFLGGWYLSQNVTYNYFLENPEFICNIGENNVLTEEFFSIGLNSSIT